MRQKGVLYYPRDHAHASAIFPVVHKHSDALTGLLYESGN